MIMKIALCAIAKLENNYIKEWVDYHLNLGFDKIFIYDNNDENGENIKDVINNNKVEIIDIRGKIPNQTDRYSECFKLHRQEYDWIAFLDIDEFIKTEFKTIKDFISSLNLNDIDVIRLPWMLFDDNNLIKVENNNYSISRFTNGHFENTTKSIVNCKSDAERITPHGPLYKKSCDPNGEICNNGTSEKIPQFSIDIKGKTFNTYINHYMLKTLEEFIKSKLKREENNPLGREREQMTIDRFFKFNKLTSEKIEYLKTLNIYYND